MLLTKAWFRFTAPGANEITLNFTNTGAAVRSVARNEQWTCKKQGQHSASSLNVITNSPTAMALQGRSTLSATCEQGLRNSRPNSVPGFEIVSPRATMQGWGRKGQKWKTHQLRPHT